MRPYSCSALLVILLLAVAGCSSEKPPAVHQVPEVGVLTVSSRVVPYTFTFVAQTESSRQVEIVARVAGFLDRIAYAEGEFVKEGQMLFQIDPKPFKAQLDSAQGELAVNYFNLRGQDAQIALLQQTIAGGTRLAHGLSQAASMMEQHEADSAHSLTSFAANA